MAKKITIENLSIIKSPHIHMKNEPAVLEKINEIVSKGASNLQFVTDYDETITKQHENEVKILHTLDVFFTCKQLPQSVVKAYNAVISKFNAIQSSAASPIERKMMSASEVIETIHTNLQGFEFDRQEITEAVRNCRFSCREATKELFLKLKNLNVPVIIISAGFGDVIEEQLSQENIQYGNVTIIANYLNYNGKTLLGLRNHQNLVGVFDKHEHLSRNVNPQVFQSRKNIILMGDRVGDATMVRDFESEGTTVLKIGFFHDRTSENSLEEYKNTFDIVLDDDQTMHVILDIIELIK